ncbi:MAG: response regulator [Bacteroidales bacterium]
MNSKVLAIDDQEDNLVSLKAIFKRFIPACDLITAGSGKKGIEKAHKEKPDVILLDIIMPGMDGYQVCRELKADKETAIIPIMMLTAIKTDTQSIVSGLEAGADAFFSKPIDPVELSAQVNVLLRMKSTEDKLRDRQQMLEDLVEERTYDLVRANTELRKEIVRRKETEDKLKIALEKAQAADRVKSNFLSSISHELRTPLNAIIGFSEIIDRDTSMDEILEFKRIINHSGNHLLYLVEGIFDLTLLESGALKIKNDDFNLDSLFEKIYHDIEQEKTKLDRDNIDISYSVQPELREKPVFTDEARIEKILTNLLTNALKFTEEGKVEYGASQEKDGSGSSLRLWVRDTGTGISKKEQEIIFDKFSQADSSLSRRYGGLGIGLTIAKKLAGLLGGKIELESEEGKGSVFTLIIPQGKKDSPVSDHDEESPGQITKDTTILIVEDENSSYQLLKIWLEKAGYKTKRAASGNAAITICSEEKNIDLVLMDLNLPEVNGYDASREIKKLRPRLPVIAHTAYAIPGNRQMALEAGCEDVLLKPLQKHEVMKAVELYLPKN